MNVKNGKTLFPMISVVCGALSVLSNLSRSAANIVFNIAGVYGLFRSIVIGGFTVTVILLALIAVIVGFMGIKSAKSNNGEKPARAIAGMAIGATMLVLTIMGFIFNSIQSIIFNIIY